MGYFPLDVISNLNENQILDNIIPEFLALIKEQTGKDFKLEDDFPSFLFSTSFFNPLYKGKYEAINEYLMNNREINKIIMHGIPFKDYKQRQTEWRDMFGECYVLSEWCKSKVVYKMDNEFFHEIKNTTNLKISSEMLSHLPVNLMYFDLSDVKNIGEFSGAWVDVHHVKDKQFMFAIYMVTNGSICPRNRHAIFSYYCTYLFNDKVTEIEIDPKDMVTSSINDYFVRDYEITDGNGTIIRQPLDRKDDHRGDIIIAIIQTLQFLHAQTEDISESEITKSTYRPSTIIKNKFSEVRMWDVGVRYGKAIKFAKLQVEKQMKEESEKEESKEKKRRKPVRPHIRSAHWQRYHVGEGRKQIKVNWIPPIYVCGGKEIPVTIHKVG